MWGATQRGPMRRKDGHDGRGGDRRQAGGQTGGGMGGGTGGQTGGGMGGGTGGQTGGGMGGGTGGQTGGGMGGGTGGQTGGGMGGGTGGQTGGGMGGGMGGGTGGGTGGQTGGGSPLPVFLFPSELLFYSEQRSSHRRVLTLYNPYSFSLHFKVLCTAPSLYRVVEAEGSVRAKSCVDLVVRHLDVSPRNRGRRDRFRLEVRGGGQVGGREIWAELRGGEEGGGQQRALSPQTPLSPLLGPTRTHLQPPTCTAVRGVSQWVVCVVVAVLCVAGLMLPLHTESSSVVPRCLHVSTSQKLVCAYTLGLLTMVFLR